MYFSLIFLKNKKKIINIFVSVYDWEFSNSLCTYRLFTQIYPIQSKQTWEEKSKQKSNKKYFKHSIIINKQHHTEKWGNKKKENYTDNQYIFSFQFLERFCFVNLFSNRFQYFVYDLYDCGFF